MKLYKQKAGVVSERPMWIFIESCYLYGNESLIKLLWEVITEWHNDRHMVG